MTQQPSRQTAAHGGGHCPDAGSAQGNDVYASVRSARIANGAQCGPRRMQSAFRRHARSAPGIEVSAVALHSAEPS